MKKIILSLALVLAASAVYAGGYRVGAQGQRSLAMGHSGVAVVNSAEMAFFNPSGLVRLENELNISAGVTGVFSNSKWQNTATGQYASTESNMSTPFYLYASYRINDRFTAGLSVSTPYGSRVEWEQDWAGSHLVNEISLQAIYIQPLISVKITENLSVGGGPILVLGGVDFDRNINRNLVDEQGNRANVEISDSGITSWGWSASAMYSPTSKLIIGANYRSEIMMDAENGDATFSNIPNSPAVPVENGVVSFNASLPLPAELSVGASYQFSEKFLASFQYDRTFWDAYESLEIAFPGSGMDVSVNPRNYKDSSIYRFGAQYIATDKITLRAGYYFDESPVQAGYFAPETPRNDANGFTAGLSFDISENLAIDASFLYLRFKELDASYDYYVEDGQQVPFSGSYKSNAFLTGIGLTYKL
ncbi:MAG: OmpP1/FadL family transporter [Bacteroidota bacterium]